MNDKEKSSVSSEKSLSIDEARDLVRKKGEFIREAKTFFGKANLERMLNLLFSDELCELDEFHLSGQVHSWEIIEYAAHNPDYSKILTEAIAIGKAFFEQVKGKMRRSMNQSIKSCKRMMNPNSNRIIRNAVFLSKQFDGQAIRGYKTYRANIVGIIEQVFSFLYFYEMSMMIRNSEELEFCKDTHSWIMKILKEENVNILSGVGYLKEIFEVFQVIKKWDREIGSLLKSVEEEAEDLLVYNDVLLEEIQDLAFFRPVERYEENIEGVRMRIIPITTEDEEYQRRFKLLNVAHVRIIFDPDILEDNDGILHEYDEERKKMDFTKETCDQNVLDIMVNRATGDLCYMGTPVPISLIMKDQKLYQKMRCFVLQFIRRYLSQVEEDLDELLVSKKVDEILPSIIDEVTEDTRGGIEEIVSEQLELIPPQEEKQGQVIQVDREEMKSELRRRAREAWEKLKKLRSSKMVDIVGKALNATRRKKGGSHRSLVPEGGGRAIHIPDHGGKALGKGLLAKILRQAGLTPLDLEGYL